MRYQYTRAITAIAPYPSHCFGRHCDDPAITFHMNTMRDMIIAPTIQTHRSVTKRGRAPRDIGAPDDNNACELCIYA